MVTGELRLRWSHTDIFFTSKANLPIHLTLFLGVREPLIGPSSVLPKRDPLKVVLRRILGPKLGYSDKLCDSSKEPV